MIEVVAHGVVGEGFMSVGGDYGVFTLEVSPGRWKQPPMVFHVIVNRDDSDKLQNIYTPGTGAIVSGEMVGEEVEGKTQFRIEASQILKTDAIDSDGRVVHHFIRGHLVGRLKREPRYSQGYANFDILSWSEIGRMTMAECRISSPVEATNFRSREGGNGTKVSVTGDFREHLFKDSRGVQRNRLILDVLRWEVMR